MICLDEFKELEETLYDFKFIPTLSRARPEDNWTGEVGRVNSAIDRLLDNGENAEAYLCGNEAMINSVTESLAAKGMKEELIYYDKF